MTLSESQVRARADWIRSVDAISGSSSPSAIVWERHTDIAEALSHVMGSNRNHAHLPGGGGRDFQAVTISHEPGCLDFRVSSRTLYRMKPRRLVLERIEPQLAESFFLLELDYFKPTGTYPEDEAGAPSRRRFRQEELVEVAPGQYYDRSVWDEGCTNDGEELPDSSNLVVRFLDGKVMLVTKGGLWNGASETYDGRHARMTAADIRAVIERPV